MYKVEDETVLDSEGNIIFFDINRFIKDICLGNCCFICGKSPHERKFNNEHILPKWILRKYKLFNKKIILPNNSDFNYSKYVIPCCFECNKLMNEEFEKPIKQLLEGGYKVLTDYLKREGPWKIYVWLNIIFLKTHFKDKSLKLHLKENGESKIADFYTWEELHHIHCIARSFYTKAMLDKMVLGSFLILPAKNLDYIEPFDYSDIYDSKTIFLRLNDIALIAVLNDSGISQQIISFFLEKISDCVSPLQLKEIFARLSFANLHLKNRPKFFSDFNLSKETHKISAHVSNEIELDEIDSNKFGKLMLFCCKDLINRYDNDQYIAICKKIEIGNYTFILDSNNQFVHNSMDEVN